MSGREKRLGRVRERIAGLQERQATLTDRFQAVRLMILDAGAEEIGSLSGEQESLRAEIAAVVAAIGAARSEEERAEEEFARERRPVLEKEIDERLRDLRDRVKTAILPLYPAAEAIATAERQLASLRVSGVAHKHRPELESAAAVLLDQAGGVLSGSEGGEAKIRFTQGYFRSTPGPLAGTCYQAGQTATVSPSVAATLISEGVAEVVNAQ